MLLTKVSNQTNEDKGTWSTTSSSIRRCLKHDKGNFCPLLGNPMTIIIIFITVYLPAQAQTTQYCQRRAPHVCQSEQWVKWTSLYYRREGNAQLPASMNGAQHNFNHGDQESKQLGHRKNRKGNHLISRETSSREKWRACSNIHLLHMDATLFFTPSSGASPQSQKFLKRCCFLSYSTHQYFKHSPPSSALPFPALPLF